MAERTIFGTARRPEAGEYWAGTMVKFYLIKRFPVADGVVLRDRVDAPVDTDGEFTVTLQVPDSGTAKWQVLFPSNERVTFNLGAGDDISIDDILNGAGDVPDDANTIEQLIQATLDDLAFDDLADVNAPAPTNGQVPVWNSGTGRWVAGTVAGGGGGAQDVGDLTATGYTSGQSPRWDGTVFAAEDYYTEVEVDALLSGKAATVHNHDERYHTASQVDELLSYKASTSHTHDDRYYTEAEIGTLLAGKADASHTHAFSAITATPTTLAGYGITNAYTIAQTDAQIAAATSTYDVLDLSANGYSAGQSPRWDGAHFLPVDYYTEAEVDTLLAGKASTSHSHAFAAITSTPTTLAGYGITDAMSEAAGDVRYGQLGASNTWALAQTFTVPLKGPAGTAALPSYAFSGDADTGMYYAGTNTLGFSAGGAQRFYVDANRLSSSVEIRAPSVELRMSTVNSNSIQEIALHALDMTGGTAPGFGLQHRWLLDASNSSNTDAMSQRVYWQTATAGSQTAYWRLRLTHNGGALADVLGAGRTGVAGSTGLWLYDEDNATLEQVTVGAADSGGTGYKLLRIPN